MKSNGTTSWVSRFIHAKQLGITILTSKHSKGGALEVRIRPTGGVQLHTGSTTTPENTENTGRESSRRILRGRDDVLDIHEALWGPLEELPDNVDDSRQEKRRREIVNNVRLLVAAVGIGHKVACNDVERDDSGRMWMLEGLSDRWFARGIRRACGFQLKGDPEAEAHGQQEKAEMWRSDDEDDEDEDDEGYDNEDIDDL